MLRPKPTSDAEAKVRFVVGMKRKRKPMHNPADEISQAERRRIPAEERRLKTYMGHALDPEFELGGRYAKVHTTTVIGSTAGPAYPTQPAGSPWAKDECPPEPLIDGRGEGLTLGYEIDRPDSAPTSTALEVEATPTPASSESYVITEAGVGRVARKFVRRF
jgi:hypothetical protein